MFRRIITRALYRIYLLGKQEDQRRDRISRIKQLKRNIVINDYSYIDDKAFIQNSHNSPEYIQVGVKSHIKGHLMTFKHGGSIKIGDYSFIGEGTRIWSAKKISIGSRVLISHDVNIHDNISHPLNSLQRHKDYIHIIEKGLQDINDLREEEVVIEDDVWIGFNATILKGVTIGRGAIIGACTLIKNDVPPFAVVVGNPARIIKYVN